MNTSEYSFENFLVGNSNRFAFNAALTVADGFPKKVYNPLLIYGDDQCALEKTHLVCAIRNSIVKNFPYYRIVCVKLDEFVNELIKSFVQKQMANFYKKYKGADFLIIEDVQFLRGKFETQREFYNIFNTLYEHGKQIVFTADRLPYAMPGLEDRIRVIFNSCLLANMQSPDDAVCTVSK